MRGYWTTVAVLLAGSSLLPTLDAAQTGFNGVILFRTTWNHIQDTTIQTTEGPRIRLDHTCQMARCTTIVDADTHVRTEIDHNAREYFRMTEADAKTATNCGI